MSLAVKYRPSTFEDGFVGQDLVAAILNKQLETRIFKNVYLFSGPSGVGKTTIARCFANAINNNVGTPIELDGATCGSVDNIRAIVDSAQQRATEGEYKIFIIDECQMLGGTTKSAWSALLKLIEEPPKYSIFMLCTTDPQKIPVAILNRVQRFNLASIPAELICERLKYICQCEGYTNYEDTCDAISKTAGGCMREAITNLERCADYSHNLTRDVFSTVLSNLSFESMFKLTWAIIDKQEETIIQLLETLYNNGQDLKQFINTYFGFVLDLYKFILFKNIGITNIPTYLATDDNPVVQATISKQGATDVIKKLTDQLLTIKTAIRADQDCKNTIIVYLLRIIRIN